PLFRAHDPAPAADADRAAAPGHQPPSARFALGAAAPSPAPASRLARAIGVAAPDLGLAHPAARRPGRLHSQPLGLARAGAIRKRAAPRRDPRARTCLLLWRVHAAL